MKEYRNVQRIQESSNNQVDTLSSDSSVTQVINLYVTSVKQRTATPRTSRTPKAKTNFLKIILN